MISIFQQLDDRIHLSTGFTFLASFFISITINLKIDINNKQSKQELIIIKKVSNYKIFALIKSFFHINRSEKKSGSGHFIFSKN